MFVAHYPQVGAIGCGNLGTKTSKLLKQLLPLLFKHNRSLDNQSHQRVLCVGECPLCSSLFAGLFTGFVDLVSKAGALGLPANVEASWLLEPSCPPCIDDCCEDGSVFLVVFILGILFSFVAVG